MEKYRFSLQVNQTEYDSFVKKNEYCNLLQSYNWAKIKNNWDHLYTGVYDENDILVGTGLVLIKHLPLGFSMFYIPRGPIMDYLDNDLLSFYFGELKKIAKKYHCIFIKFDPGIKISRFHLGEEKEVFNHEKLLKSIEACGSKYYGYTENMSDTVQPRFHMVEYKDDFSLEKLNKKGKKNIKIAQKSNLDICFGNLELLDDFSKIMKKTEERKGILLRDKEYYRLLLDTYKDDAFITLAYFSIKEALEVAKLRYKECLYNLENCPHNSKKKRFTLEELKESLEIKIKKYEKDLYIYGDKVCVCGTLTVKYGETSEILYAGMDDEFKQLMGPYLTWFKTMEKCFEKGCETSNMGGIEGNLKGGLVSFKEVYHPKINEFIGEFDIPVNKPLYILSQKAYSIFRKKTLG